MELQELTTELCLILFSRLQINGRRVIPLHEPELAMVELDFAIKSGLEAIWIPHYALETAHPVI